MTEFTKNELISILGMYIFEGAKIPDIKLKKLTDKFNFVFNHDYSSQIISYAISVFKNLDTRNNANPVILDNKTYKELWDFYVEDDRITDLKKEYINFKSYDVQQYYVNVNEQNIQSELNANWGKMSYTKVIDAPKELYNIDKISEKCCNQRDLKIVFNALNLANFKCEVDENHWSFIRKSNNHMYTEGHHLIPLSFQYKFDVNLDVEANVVSLCSTCHNQLHYGKNIKEILLKLYNKRKDRLKKCGINITFAELLDMYK